MKRLDGEPEERIIRLVMRFSLSIGITALIIAGLLYGCIAWAQEEDGPVIRVEPAMYFPTNGTNQAFIERRAAQPPIPALPRKISRTISTNDAGERVTVLIEALPDPVALIQDKRKERWFWTWCPLCEERRHFKADAIKIGGWRKDSQTTDEIIAERELFFTCLDCTNSFSIRDERRIKQPIAVEVPPPTVKGSKP